jgi:hypothetical protein
VFIATSQGSSRGKIKGSFDFTAALPIGKPPDLPLTITLPRLSHLLDRRPMLHPEVPVIAPKPAPHDGLDGAEFGDHLGERLCALEDRP